MQLIRWFLVSLFAVGAAALAQAQTEAPVKVVVPAFTFPAKAQVGGRTLVLNGAGTRYRAVFQVYQAGLYLEKPAHHFVDMQSPTEARRIQLVMLREVKSDELGKLFARGIQDNLDKASAARLMSSMWRMSELFTEYKRLDAGDQIILDWVPGKGTVVTVKGKVSGEPFKEPEFFNALLGIWLGNVPADWKLKDALLGKPA